MMCWHKWEKWGPVKQMAGHWIWFQYRQCSKCAAIQSRRINEGVSP